MLQTVRKRSGEIVHFDLTKISVAMQQAFAAADEAADEDRLDALADTVRRKLDADIPDGPVDLEHIQDVVEQELMGSGHFKVAKQYILYRQARTDARRRRAGDDARRVFAGELGVTKRDGERHRFALTKIEATLERLAGDLEAVDYDPILTELKRNIYDGIATAELEHALVLSVIAYIERDPEYNILAARLVRQRVYREVFGESVGRKEFDARYREAFKRNIELGVASGVYAEGMGARFDLSVLAAALRLERDDDLRYLGVQTLYERYFLRIDGRLIETPQAFWMRVAMGLALGEDDPTKWAVEFYRLLSELRFVSSTPTLFHAGTSHPQLSSCYLSTVRDDLEHIFKCIGDNAQMSKWSGGIGNDWSYIRATGAEIKSTKVESQGVIPFLKIANDTTVAINRSGKRRGATCAYLETWHLDIEDFLDLRRNTGDDRRRTHDMNTANWVPDLFMERVSQDAEWTLFSPDEVPDLHDLYGAAFQERYRQYEALAAEGGIRHFRKVEATKLWRKMLTRLFETGHPWITFKDPSNVRSPQDHAGVVHNSNLCTEITLNNSADETAVCNLGSINLARHVDERGLNHFLLQQTVHTAMRMLDNVVDINFYPTREAENSNLRHRPVGLGLMGFQDALFTLRLPMESNGAAEFCDSAMEFISYHAILGSSNLAAERGSYSSYAGSKWERGIFPLDTLDLLERERGSTIPIDRTARLDWSVLKATVKRQGIRNSNTMAIAPTATISNIAGVYPSIEPIYKNLYVKANMSGEFTVINEHLVRDLKRLGMWHEEMLEQLKYYDGNVSNIPGMPQELIALYQEAFDIDAVAAIKLTALRGKWIDQSQSHNVFIRGTSGKKLHDVYTAAWRMGLKTTYYLRSLGASQIEKSTLDAQKYGYTQKRPDVGTPAARQPEASIAGVQPVSNTTAATSSGESASICSLTDPECEACQ